MSKAPSILAMLVGLALISCGDPPTTPSGPPITPPPPPSNVSNLRIEGPASIPPGETAQFRLIATFFNGTSTDVAAQATWTSSNSSALSFAAGGLATARARGETHVTARFQGRSSNGVAVFVLEDGTFRLSGRVTESGSGLPEARVEVVSGAGTGLSATTSFNGSFALYGVGGAAVIDVTLDGFEKERRSILVTGHSSLNVELRPTVQPTDLRGDWRLMFTASAACTTAVPEDAAARSYLVTILQAGTQLQVQPKSPSLVPPSWLQTTGRVVDRTVTLTLPVDDFYYSFYGIKFYSIIEVLGPGRILALGGTARGDRVGDVVTGTFDGDFSLYRNENNGAVWDQILSCGRNDHGFRLDRN